MTDALDAVIDAALERALLDADDARRYFALAGALDRGRAGALADNTGTPRPEHGGEDLEHPKPGVGSTHALGAALLSTVAIGALESTEPREIDPGAWSPGDPEGTSHTELVAAGAAAACRRFDVGSGVIAARSGLPPERFVRYLIDGDAAAGSR